jgi:hypothetical protein
MMRHRKWGGQKPDNEAGKSETESRLIRPSSVGQRPHDGLEVRDRGRIMRLASVRQKPHDEAWK